jgi:cytochrome c oxidase assembly protein subunit 15
MNGRLFPDHYAGPGLWATVAHSQGAVQLHHRLVAYVLFISALVMGTAAWRSAELAPDAKRLALTVSGAVVLQACLGVATLVAVAPLGLSLTHQVMAAIVLCLAVAFAWRARRP